MTTAKLEPKVSPPRKRVLGYETLNTNQNFRTLSVFVNTLTRTFSNSEFKSYKNGKTPEKFSGGPAVRPKAVRLKPLGKIRDPLPHIFPPPSRPAFLGVFPSPLNIRNYRKKSTTPRKRSGYVVLVRY
jgi:hypothetical protein